MTAGQNFLLRCPSNTEKLSVNFPGGKTKALSVPVTQAAYFGRLNRIKFSTATDAIRMLIIRSLLSNSFRVTVWCLSE